MSYGYGSSYGYPYSPRFGPQTGVAGYQAPYGYQPPIPAVQSAPAPAQTSNTGVFAVQPVSSKEEALAVIADPMGPGVLLPDLGHGVVYVKRFNPNTGCSDFGEFVYQAPSAQPDVAQSAQTGPAAQPDLTNYVTRPDLDAAINQLRGELAPARAGKNRKEAATDE